MSSARRKVRLIVEGPPGKGKTTAIAALRNAVKAQGGTLIYEEGMDWTANQRRILDNTNVPDDVLGDFDFVVVERDGHV